MKIYFEKYYIIALLLWWVVLPAAAVDRPDMYVGIDQSFGLYNGEEEFSGKAPVGSALGTSTRIFIGKDISPAWGFRATFGFSVQPGISSAPGWMSYYDNSTQNFTEHPIYYEHAKTNGKILFAGKGDTRGYFIQQINHVNLSVEVMYNLVGGTARKVLYRQVAELSPFIGPELIYVLGNETVPSNFMVGAKAGLWARFRLSQLLDLNFTFTGHIYPDLFDGEVGQVPLEGSFDFGIGLTFKIDFPKCHGCK